MKLETSATFKNCSKLSPYGLIQPKGKMKTIIGTTAIIPACEPKLLLTMRYNGTPSASAMSRHTHWRPLNGPIHLVSYFSVSADDVDLFEAGYISKHWKPP